MTRKHPKRWLQVAFNIALIVGLVTALSYLPPDTSLADRQKAGTLKLCVPPSYPPLVTNDPERPGFDIELARAIADKLNLRLAVNVLPSIGKDFNPRNWSLTRAQCDIVAGGVADTEQTRGYLQTLTTGVETGWVGISATTILPPTGSTILVLPGTSGLNRVALSTWLRQQGLRGQPAQSADQLLRALDSGSAAVAITERFVAGTLDPEAHGYRVFWLPQEALPRMSMALALWKGDQTLRRAVGTVIQDLQANGALEELRRRYDLEIAPTVLTNHEL